MLVTQKDGEMRLLSGTTLGHRAHDYHMELLFTDANLSAPVTRKKTEERLVMDRGVMDSNAHYVEGGDAPIMEPLPFTISCKVDGTTSGVTYLDAWFRMGGTSITTINTKTIRSTQGYTANVSGTSNPHFNDASKRCCDIATRWTGAGSGTTVLVYLWEEVYFPPGEQTIAEAEDGMTLSLSGQIYGNISKVTGFPTSWKGSI